MFNWTQLGRLLTYTCSSEYTGTNRLQISIATLTAAVGGAIISSSGSSESVPKTAAAPAVVAEKADDIDVEKLLK